MSSRIWYSQSVTIEEFVHRTTVFFSVKFIASDTYCDAFHFITVKSAELTHAHIHSLIQCFFVQVYTVWTICRHSNSLGHAWTVEANCLSRSF